jgi:hypothetical protein
MIKIKPRKIFGIFIIVLMYLSSVLFYFSRYPEIGIRDKLVYSMMLIIFSPYHLFVLIIGIYFLILRKHRIIDFILIVIFVILFLPIPPFYTVFPTPGFTLWGDVFSPFLISQSGFINMTENITEERGIQYLEGNATLEVKILAPDDTPFQNLEVDLWTADAPLGPPNVGINYTNKDGIVIFKIPPGRYKIGFNLKNFPKNIVYPEPVEVEVTEKEVAQKIIKLQPK